MIEKVSDIVIQAHNHPIMRDVKRNFTSAPSSEVECKCCKKMYIRGFWDFYNLCDLCFRPFDMQRHRLRFTNQTIENVDEWIKMNICTHGELEK